MSALFIFNPLKNERLWIAKVVFLSLTTREAAKKLLNALAIRKLARIV